MDHKVQFGFDLEDVEFDERVFHNNSVALDLSRDIE